MLRILAGMAVAWALGSPPAMAGTATESRDGGTLAPAATSQDRAGDLHAEGLDLYQHGDFQAAIERFQKALEINPKDTELYGQIGATYDRLGDKGKALNYYRRYLEKCPKCSHAAEVEKVVRDFERRHGVDRVPDAKPPSPPPAPATSGTTIPVPDPSGFGSVDVLTTVPFTSVFIDGEKIHDSSLLNYILGTGWHTVEIKNKQDQLIRHWRVYIKNHQHLRLRYR